MRMFRSLLILFILIISATGAFAQQVTVDPSAISPSQIDLSKVNLADVRFYFEGPAQFYVTGIRYNGYTYSAVLDHDGSGVIKVKAPTAPAVAAKPMLVDLSTIALGVGPEGIRLENVGVDGMSYSGTLAISPENDLVVTSYAPTGPSAAGRPNADQIISLRNQVAALEHQVSSLQDETNARESTITILQQQVSSLQNEAIAREDTVSGLRERLAAGAAPTPSAAPSVSDYPNLLIGGLTGGRADYGQWSFTGSELEQQSADHLFAKYVAEMPQGGDHYFYEFSGRATGSGWRGFGVHFLASGSGTATGYGFGNSYLVWVTYDPDHLQTDRTFVQLYRSYNDVHMIQLASKAIPNSIAQTNTYGVAVDRLENTVTVLVNGNQIFSYSPGEQIEAGDTIALRALGTVTFSSAQIRTK